MKCKERESAGANKRLPKTPTGIDGLDEITDGGLPRGRPTLLCGGAGSGKTLMAMEFIVNGITRHNEPGAFITFEETVEEMLENVASLGFDLHELVQEDRLFIHEIDLEQQDFIEAGSYNLDGLFAQLGYAIDRVGAKRVVIDGIEALFSHFSRERTLRAEMKRIFRWLKEKGVTAIITGVCGDRDPWRTRHGIEEFLSDCVIFLDQRIDAQVATRRLHIQKYRGSRHGSNEYPFLVTDGGISVLPITSIGLDHEASTERISTGCRELDEMFGGKGWFKGSGILVSGFAGTGKSSFAAQFANSVCRNGGQCIYFAMEESAPQIIRNMRSIGLDLSRSVDKGLLRFFAMRPTMHGLETHLLNMHNTIREFRPDAVIIDPVSNLTSIATLTDIKLMFIRILDHLKKQGITALCTDLTSDAFNPESTEVGISSIMDTWMLLNNTENMGRRDRSIFILKSRGMPHSNETRPFRISDKGIVIEEKSKSGRSS